MKRLAGIVLIIWLALLPQATANPKSQQSRDRNLAPSQIAQITIRSVVVLRAEDSKAAYYGSGFFVRNDLIVTNYHVVKDSYRISARLVGRDKMRLSFTSLHPSPRLLLQAL